MMKVIAPASKRSIKSPCDMACGGPSGAYVWGMEWGQCPTSAHRFIKYICDVACGGPSGTYVEDGVVTAVVTAG